MATAISLWGDADQQSRYLEPFTGEDVPAAALAVMEPRPLFDPLELETTAIRKGESWVLNGIKSLVPARGAGGAAAGSRPHRDRRARAVHRRGRRRRAC